MKKIEQMISMYAKTRSIDKDISFLDNYVYDVSKDSNQKDFSYFLILNSVFEHVEKSSFSEGYEPPKKLYALQSKLHEKKIETQNSLDALARVAIEDVESESICEYSPSKALFEAGASLKVLNPSSASYDSIVSFLDSRLKRNLIPEKKETPTSSKPSLKKKIVDYTLILASSVAMGFFGSGLYHDFFKSSTPKPINTHFVGDSLDYNVVLDSVLTNKKSHELYFSKKPFSDEEKATFDATKILSKSNEYVRRIRQ